MVGRMTYLYASHFMSAQDLADFVNEEGIVGDNILKIDADASNGGWVLFWFGAPPE